MPGLTCTKCSAGAILHDDSRGLVFLGRSSLPFASPQKTPNAPLELFCPLPAAALSFYGRSSLPFASRKPPKWPAAAPMPVASRGLTPRCSSHAPCQLWHCISMCLSMSFSPERAIACSDMVFLMACHAGPCVEWQPMIDEPMDYQKRGGILRSMIRLATKMVPLAHYAPSPP